MNRLFTFGCSFTYYYWQTWADIIGTQFNTYQNWGQAGAGNNFITSNLYECNSLYKINKDDVVMIMFSSIDRFDYINQQSYFVTKGSVYGESHPLGSDFVLNEWSDEHAVYMTWYSILSAKTLLDSIGCKYIFMKAFDFDSHNGYNLKINKESNRINHCINEINTILKGPSLYEMNKECGDFYKFNDTPNQMDGHPTIKTHLRWVKENLKDYYHEEMDEICKLWETKIPLNRNDNNTQPKKSYREFLDFKTKNILKII